MRSIAPSNMLFGLCLLKRLSMSVLSYFTQFSYARKFCVTFFVRACLYVVEEEEDIQLTEGEIEAALNRDDDLGRLVMHVFSFSVAPFEEVFGKDALVVSAEEGATH